MVDQGRGASLWPPTSVFFIYVAKKEACRKAIRRRDKGGCGEGQRQRTVITDPRVLALSGVLRGVESLDLAMARAEWS